MHMPSACTGFFFSSRRRHTRCLSDWSSDVCSSDLELAIPSLYGQDRLFCYIRQKGAADPVQDAKMEAIKDAGHAVVQIDLHDIYDLGQEFFRWELAIATAGFLLGINPFDQPDVESSK